LGEPKGAARPTARSAGNDLGLLEVCFGSEGVRVELIFRQLAILDEIALGDSTTIGAPQA